MPAGPATIGPAPPRPPLCDSDVLIALGLIAIIVVVVALVQGGLAPLPWPPHSLKLRVLAVVVIGGLTGFAELVSRYRDEPWAAAGSAPGLAYIALNAIVSLLALLLMEHAPEATAAPADGVARVILAGTGAMVLLRARLFTLRQPDGSEVAVGPAMALEQILGAVNRDIDRRRAAHRHRLVTRAAEALAHYDFAESVRFLRPALLAFQALDPAERTTLNKSLAELQQDPALAPQPATIKYKYFFFDLLTVCGEQTFASIYGDLLTHLQAMPPPEAGATVKPAAHP